MFLVNSRFPLVSAAAPRCGRRAPSRDPAPLLPKLRGQVAEFLNHSSLARLGMLYLTTCVGLGYGPPRHSLEAFLGSMGSPTSPGSGSASDLGLGARRICRPRALPPYPGTTTARDGLPSCVTPSLADPAARVAPAAPGHPQAAGDRRRLSIAAGGTGAPRRVRDYQPVVHRLRLSASP